MIIYEDSDLLIINKPPGLLSHKNLNQPNRTSVVEMLQSKIYYDKNRDKKFYQERNGLVHRLDQDTSGVMVLAKNETMVKLLQVEFRLRRVIKEYFALVYGNIYKKQTLINFLARDKKKRNQKKIVYRKTPDSREAVTHIEPVEFFLDKTLLRVNPVTGRTHQIRLQLTHLGYPILGDKLYFFKKNLHQKENKLFLCAKKISFTHPRLKKKVTGEVPLPVFFDTKLKEELLQKKNLEKNYSSN